MSDQQHDAKVPDHLFLGGRTSYHQDDAKALDHLLDTIRNWKCIMLLLLLLFSNIAPRH